jgi:hypothetical protein
VVDEQLAAAAEQLRQRARAAVGLEAVLLLDANPRQLAPLPCQLVTQAGVLLLPSEQLLAGGRPILATHDLVIGHHVLLSGAGGHLGAERRARSSARLASVGNGS